MENSIESTSGKARPQMSADGQCDCACVSASASRCLTAWMHLTTSCNLSCEYCYLVSSTEKMSLQVGLAAVQAAVRSAQIHGFEAVKLKYAGGEPTLNFSVLVELQRSAQRLAEQTGLKLDAVALSNGVDVTPTMLRALKGLDVRLAISVDGVGSFHDRHRHSPNGLGSFVAVSRTIDLALLEGLVPEISVTISNRNIDGVSELVEWVLDHDLLFSLNFYRSNERVASRCDLELESNKIIAGMEAVLKVIGKRLPNRNLLASLLDRANCAVSHTHTCQVGDCYMVIDQRGRISKCQMDIDNCVTDICDPDPLLRIRSSSRGVQNLHVDEKLECCACQWRYWCTGGCPLQTYRMRGRYDVKSPHCDIYRILIPQVIHLEKLRTLKYGAESPFQSPFSRPVYNASDSGLDSTIPA